MGVTYFLSNKLSSEIIKRFALWSDSPKYIVKSVINAGFPQAMESPGKPWNLKSVLESQDFPFDNF